MLELLNRVWFEILWSSPEGLRYANLACTYGPEISRLWLVNPALRAEATRLLWIWEPGLQALVDGQGSTVTITADQVGAVQTFLDNLSAAGSSELQQTIAVERASKPLEQAIGQTLDQARFMFLGYSPTPIPSTLVTPTPH